jgi:hypothetical protein
LRHDQPFFLIWTSAFQLSETKNVESTSGFDAIASTAFSSLIKHRVFKRAFPRWPAFPA